MRTDMRRERESQTITNIWSPSFIRVIINKYKKFKNGIRKNC